MLKNLYVLAWFLLGAAIVAAASTGVLTPAMLVVFSLAVLGLVYGFALWSVIVNTRDIKAE